jgi:hypothetical protein
MNMRQPHVMDNDGVNIHQSMNQSHDLDRLCWILVRRVQSLGQHGQRNAISLYKMHPDGSALQLFYGAHSHATGTNGADVHFCSHARCRMEGC